MKKKNLDYGTMFTLRKDGRYQGYRYDEDGVRHAVCDRDPERLWHRIYDAPEQKPTTFADIAEAWQGVHWERVGYKTAEAYTAPLKRLNDSFGDIPATDLSAQMIYALLSDLAKKGYSRRSVQMHRDIVNMIYNNAIVDGKATVNPCASVSMPRNLPTSKRQLPEDAAITAVKESDAPFSLFAKICLYAGMRRGEALALRYEDIDWTHGVIHVTKAVEFVGNNPHLKSPKTEAGYRDAILPDILKEAITHKKGGFIFAREDGGLLTKMQFRKRWLAYCEAIGYDITPHQLRHGFATILYEAGIADKDAQEFLGHSSITVTRDIYTHIRQSRKSEAVSKFNSYVGKADGNSQKSEENP